MGLKILTIQFLYKVVILAEYREQQGNRQSQKQRNGFSALIDYDVDGFGKFLWTQTCTDCYWLSTIYNANYFRSAHLYLFLNGVSSISKEGVELNIMRATGNVSACKEICPNHLFMALYFQVYIW
jgi:hypothetical protein